MSENQPAESTAAQQAQPTKQAQLKDIEAIRDLFARAHDYIAQASHPGHLGMKVGEVLNFLAFQYNDFKTRAENLGKKIEEEAKQLESKVDVEAAKIATNAALTAKQSIESKAFQGSDAPTGATKGAVDAVPVEKPAPSQVQSGDTVNE